MNRRLVIEVFDDDMADVLHRKTPAQRLAATHAIWRAAHAGTLEVVRHLHGIKYGFTESQASCLYGENRFTHDIDVVAEVRALPLLR